MIKSTNTTGSSLAVVLITLNEGHNLRRCLDQIIGWASEIYVLDSYSSDDTVDIALEYGATVYQRRFRGFGDQWNFALRTFPITSAWIMKLDPDEIVTDELKASISTITDSSDSPDAIKLRLQLYFMGKSLPVFLEMTRVWRTGSCNFSGVDVNEHLLVQGKIAIAGGIIEHRDSPNLDHWIRKQNKYTTAEAKSQYEQKSLSVEPKLFGSALERRMWIKRNFWKVPGRYKLLFLYHYLYLGTWRAGRVGWIWSHLRTEVYRTWEYKKYEMDLLGGPGVDIPSAIGQPDPRAQQFD
ncbi:glycosyltransferase family 2 protein [Orrella marina]|uniref:Glycosyl transferase n=1 Tax=Orrella marina TaxID=2163011 RepID=A0A2R4XGR8_9BURK|nr:glycosyltransferase family 2 protein [Orrella marina]AWB33028.1 glycosyl transferase [Orrella marina]